MPKDNLARPRAGPAPRPASEDMFRPTPGPGRRGSLSCSVRSAPPMHLSPLDWAIVGVYVLLALGSGLFFAKRAGQDTSEYFLAGRRLPWWIAGTSMVATTFACDTPLVISGWVREGGIWQNWMWWSLTLCNVLAVVLFARYWRRGGVMTTAELAELRYGGPSAKVLRGVLGVFQAGITNCIILCWVLLAAAKILDVLFELDKDVSLLLASLVALSYSVLAGFWAVVVTDLVQFTLALIGAVVLAVFAWDAIGNTEGLAAAVQAGTVASQQLALLPSAGPGGLFDASFWTIPVASLVVWLGVQWWAYEYVDGGIIAVQRISASRSERDGVLAMLWYSVLHYAVRPWPWILVGIASLVMLPSVEVTAPVDGTIRSVDATRGAERLVLAPDDGSADIVVDLRALEPRDVFASRPGPSGWYPTQVMVNGAATALDAVPAGVAIEEGAVIARTDPERAYVVMLAGLLPVGLLGIAVTALLAAFMSTIDTHVNLASSFFVNDLYRRFMRRTASPTHYVNVGRVASVCVLAFAAFLASLGDSIGDLFTFFLAFLSGVGPIYVLRWLWWRIKASTEIVAMVASSCTATTLKFADTLHEVTGFGPFGAVAGYEWSVPGLSEGGSLTAPGVLVLTVAVSSAVALLSLLLTKRPAPESLVDFYRRVRPAGAWGPVRALCPEVSPPEGPAPVLLGWLGGVLAIYGLLFALGEWFLGERGLAGAFAAVMVVGAVLLVRSLRALDATASA
jgi:SSS family solute:Na+ symporter